MRPQSRTSGSWFGNRYLNIDKKIRLTAFALAIAGWFASSSFADVQTSGILDPAFNPFTGGGLPVSGNFINPATEPNPNNPSAQNQTTFEGLSDINVGQSPTANSTGFGEVIISSDTALRYENLILGNTSVSNQQNPTPAVGVFRIDGFDALFNNNPTILPFGLNYATFGSKRSATQGYDVVVGATGTGTLEISAGGRAEIQDAVLVGDQVGATGTLTVDGFDSFLGSGGFNTQGGGGGTPGGIYHLMIIGRQGTGAMTISGGATVDSEAPAATGGGSGNQQGAVGVSLGSSPYTNTLQLTPDAGGSGTATVTGTGSKWIIGGSLQVGGFDIGTTTNGAATTIGDPVGTSTQYSSQIGHAVLNVTDGGEIDIRNGIGVAPTDITTSLIVGIGRFGTVYLNNGTIRIGNANVANGGNSGGGNNATPDSVAIVNDGVITGTGQIETGVFQNRVYGEVRVNAGQSMVITSTSQFQSAGGATPPAPMTNYGKINVLGTTQAQAEIEFVRAPVATTQNPSPVQPFMNLPLPTVTTGTFGGGQIAAQFANLHFDSGLQNQSMMSFTAGTNNVTGKVVNIFTADTDEPDADTDDFAVQMVVSGVGTKAVFHDPLSFGPATTLSLVNGGNVDILNQNGLTLAGKLNIELSYANPSLVNVAGNLGIGQPGSELAVSLDGDVLHSLKSGDAFKVIAYNGALGNVDLTNPADPVQDFTTPFTGFSTVTTSPDIKTLYGLDTVVLSAPQGIYVEFLNPALVGSGAMGPDFNGDGKVDSADLAIWQAHVGIMSGASVLEGDANGDGKVDGQDFLIWQRNVGKPKPWSGSGSGSSIGQTTIPEPTSLAMLLGGATLALAFGRKRRQG